MVLLQGGDKSSQSKDITKARAYWKDYQAAKKTATKEEAKKPAEKKADKKEDER